MGRKNKGKASAAANSEGSEDDALLDAAIAEAARQRETTQIEVIVKEAPPRPGFQTMVKDWDKRERWDPDRLASMMDGRTIRQRMKMMRNLQKRDIDARKKAEADARQREVDREVDLLMKTGGVACMQSKSVQTCIGMYIGMCVGTYADMPALVRTVSTRANESFPVV